MAELNSGNPRKNIPKDLLNDLSSRFIINVPEEERVDLVRLCFQIELAHWFYLDFYCEENPKLPKVTVREFIHIIFRHIPFLKKYNQEIDSVIANWREYKSAVPTYGAILLDQDLKNVLLVQSFYSKASWGFPKGKVNEEEKPHVCAIREVFEETGFDISSLIKQDEFLEHYFNDQLIRLYIITGIAPNAKFQPQTRKEIKAIEWFPVNKLPTSKKDVASRSKFGPNNFFMVIPFVKQLEKWIAAKLSENEVKNEKKLCKDKNFVNQQRLFSQLTKKDLAEYTNRDENSDDKNVRSNKSPYSPPPRMARLKNTKHASENDRKKSFQNDHQKEKIFFNSNLTKNFGVLDIEEKTRNLNEENILLQSKTWKSFSLDCEALIAIFNISLRKTSPIDA